MLGTKLPRRAPKTTRDKKKAAAQMFTGAAVAPSTPVQPATMFAGPLQGGRSGGFDWATLAQGLGAGLLSAPNWGQGVGQGVMYARQFADQNRQSERDARRDEMDATRFDFEKQKYQTELDQAAAQQAEREKMGAAALDMFRAALDQDPSNDIAGLTPQIARYGMSLPVDMQAELLGPLLMPKEAEWKIETIREGNQDVTYRINPATGDRERLGAGAAWAPQQGDGGPKTSLVPFYTTDKDGNVHMFQPTASGVPVEVQLPPGMAPTKPLSFQDLGTSILPVQPLGGAAGTPIPKDIAGVEQQKIEGKGTGEAVESYRSMTSKMPGLEQVVARLNELSDKATYTTTGQGIDFAMREAGMEPRESAIARAEYISIISNQVLPLLRDTFGAAFTEREGARLQATMGDPNKSPKEKQAELKAFIEQKRRDIEAAALKAMAGGNDVQPAPSTPGAGGYDEQRGTAPKRVKVDADGNVIQ